MATQKQKGEFKEIKRLFDEEVSGVDRVSFSGKMQEFIFKRFYFYRHGMSADKFATKIIEELEKRGYVLSNSGYSDNWNPWPKDSWFEFRCRLSR